MTDWNAQASCTAGSVALTTGQLPRHTGLSTVGMPGAAQGLQAEEPTVAKLLEPFGYIRRPSPSTAVGDDW